LVKGFVFREEHMKKLAEILKLNEGMMVVDDDGHLIDQENVLPPHTEKDIEEIVKGVLDPSKYVRYANLKIDTVRSKNNSRLYCVTLTMNHSNWHTWIDIEFVPKHRQILLSYKYTDQEIGGNLEKIHTDIFRDSTMSNEDDIDFLVGRLMEIIRYGVAIAERDKMWGAGWGKEVLKITKW
jgi:hypothetical protein